MTKTNFKAMKKVWRYQRRNQIEIHRRTDNAMNQKKKNRKTNNGT